MPAYIHGSLAAEQKTGQKVTVKETKKAVQRNKSLPVQEKLLYLFTVLVCVVVASVIIWRYAQIYEMNTKVLKIEQDIQQLQAENSVLKHKIESLSVPDRLKQEALKFGMVPADDKQISKVPAKVDAPMSAAADQQTKAD
ncbi:cell division protein FtsL [Paenibacillus xerothermodurans]|uniref:Cell division protein FtsL n=1 Tax=Paenibacillus xerothermodurans TaxID=1977292 RepID=A0A2W1ND79_PAEXE|nr:cell division protein FtsL [Paenibacillus xerothermodurans]PZE22659.1 cell division protein FtsL [Paenibacillus xerothermodurans]